MSWGMNVASVTAVLKATPFSLMVINSYGTVSPVRKCKARLFWILGTDAEGTFLKVSKMAGRTPRLTRRAGVRFGIG